MGLSGPAKKPNPTMGNNGNRMKSCGRSVSQVHRKRQGLPE
jgi:hypothetical protein